MFNLKYFCSYEVLLPDEGYDRGSSILILPLFGKIEHLVAQYCYSIAEIYGVEDTCVVITQLNKLN